MPFRHITDKDDTIVSLRRDDRSPIAKPKGIRSFTKRANKLAKNAAKARAK
jgi:hypothetical protein